MTMLTLLQWGEQPPIYVPCVRGAAYPLLYRLGFLKAPVIDEVILIPVRWVDEKPSIGRSSTDASFSAGSSKANGIENEVNVTITDHHDIFSRKCVDSTLDFGRKMIVGKRKRGAENIIHETKQIDQDAEHKPAAPAIIKHVADHSDSGNAIVPSEVSTTSSRVQRRIAATPNAILQIPKPTPLTRQAVFTIAFKDLVENTVPKPNVFNIFLASRTGSNSRDHSSSAASKISNVSNKKTEADHVPHSDSHLISTTVTITAAPKPRVINTMLASDTVRTTGAALP
ncbi:hypothetical protein HK102_001210 [Quaeritorhiza haematococci]|nr:hypothetical protein HK102_001210 [Quaeritorhiza haematococci]